MLYYKKWAFNVKKKLHRLLRLLLDLGFHDSYVTSKTQQVVILFAGSLLFGFTLLKF